MLEGVKWQIFASDERYNPKITKKYTNYTLK